MLNISDLKARRQSLTQDLERTLFAVLDGDKTRDHVLVDPDAFVLTGKDGGALQVYSVDLVPASPIKPKRLALGCLGADPDDTEGEDVTLVEKKDVPAGMWLDILLDGLERLRPTEKEQQKQRCNHCMAVFDEDATECPCCGKDDALMFPFIPSIEDVSWPPPPLSEKEITVIDQITAEPPVAHEVKSGKAK